MNHTTHRTVLEDLVARGSDDWLNETEVLGALTGAGLAIEQAWPAALHLVGTLLDAGLAVPGSVGDTFEPWSGTVADHGARLAKAWRSADPHEVFFGDIAWFDLTPAGTGWAWLIRVAGGEAPAAGPLAVPDLAGARVARVRHVAQDAGAPHGSPWLLETSTGWGIVLRDAPVVTGTPLAEWAGRDLTAAAVTEGAGLVLAVDGGRSVVAAPATTATWALGGPANRALVAAGGRLVAC